MVLAPLLPVTICQQVIKEKEGLVTVTLRAANTGLDALLVPSQLVCNDS